MIAHSAEEAIAKAKDGMILVVPTTDKEYMPAIEKAAALVVEDGGLTSCSSCRNRERSTSDRWCQRRNNNHQRWRIGYS